MGQEQPLIVTTATPMHNQDWRTLTHYGILDLTVARFDDLAAYL
jgi:hypothetical protein